MQGGAGVFVVWWKLFVIRVWGGNYGLVEENRPPQEWLVSGGIG